jgi:gliding motility-associated-like protein
MISGSCGDTSSISITVDPIANSSIIASGPWCTNTAPAVLTAVTGGGTWSGAGIANASTGLFDPDSAGPGTHQIIYTISGACGSADTAYILVNQAPGLYAAYVPETCTGANDASITPTVTGGTAPYTYVWSTGATTLAIANLQPGSYWLTCTDVNGCQTVLFNEFTASDTPCEEIPVVAYIPNIFSPNGDGESANNTFMVLGQGIVNVELTVFDRWGEKVFESKDLAVGWNGEYKGKPMDQGVYVYTAIIEFVNGEVITKKGNVTLVR